MTLWVIQLGGSLDREDFVTTESAVVTVWDDLPDVSKIASREAMRTVLDQHRNAKPQTVLSWAGQFWNFKGVMAVDDIVVVPVTKRGVYRIGRVIGPYMFRADAGPACRHTRPVKWIGEINRAEVARDIKYSLKAHMSVYTVSRNNIKERLLGMLGEKV